MEQEIWRDVKGFEGLYQVSNLGNVRTFPRERCQGNVCRVYGKEKTMRLQFQSNGYYAVWLRDRGRNVKAWVHRLVATAFFRDPEPGEQVNHKNKDRTNNCIENLEWCSCVENAWHRENVEPF